MESTVHWALNTNLKTLLTPHRTASAKVKPPNKDEALCTDSLANLQSDDIDFDDAAASARLEVPSP